MTSVTIKQKKVLSLNLSFNEDFKGRELLKDAQVSVSPIIDPSEPDDVFLVVDFDFNCDSMSDDFKLRANIEIAFVLNKTSDIQKTDFYKCVELTKEHLQNIINATFDGQTPINVSTIGIDVLSDMLDDKIQTIQYFFLVHTLL